MFKNGLSFSKSQCIYYFTQLNEFIVETFIDSSSKINSMQPIFAKKLGLCICKNDMGTEKIDSSRPETYKIVILLFQMKDKDGKSRFFEKTFQLADISINDAFRMFFLNLSNTTVNFNN